MPQTQVRSPDGQTITVQHPEGATREQILAYAKQNYQPPAPQEASPFASHYSPEGAVGIGEKLLSLGTGTIGMIGGGLGGIASMLPGGRSPAVAVEDISSALTYQPRTEAGQRETFFGDAMRWLEEKADAIGEGAATSSEDESIDPLAATLTKTAVLGLPALFMRGRGRPAPRQAVAETPAETMGLSSETISTAGDRLVTNTFQRFRETVGEETPVPMTNTTAAAQTALQNLAKQGMQQSRVATMLRRMLSANKEGTTTVALLDDIAGNLMQAITNRRGTGKRQARAVLNGVVEDMNQAGLPAGMNFADDLANARAFGDLYRHRSNLGRVMGQHGERLQAYRASNPQGFQEIITDWASKRLETFVRTNEAGGRQFNTAQFSEWVTQNEPALNALIGPEMLGVWKAFPQFHGRANLVKGIVQRVASAKSGGLSSFFNKKIDMKFSEALAQMLSDPTSPLYKLLAPRSSGAMAVPALPYGTESGINAQIQGQ